MTTTATKTTPSALALFVQHRGGLVLGYQRISRDVTAEKLGVTRQESDCEAYALERGVAVDDNYQDNDTSGWSGKTRAGYQAMLQLIREDRVAVVIAWHLDRLTRNPLEFERLMALLQVHNVKLVTVTAGDLDPTSPDGMLLARMTGAVAAYESDHKSRRITRKHKDMADKGEFHGGRRRFGYEAGMAKVRKSEADLVTDLASRLLAGESLHSCAKGLNAAHVPTPSSDGTCKHKAGEVKCGQPVELLEDGVNAWTHQDASLDNDHAPVVTAWTGSNLRTMMLRPHLAGLRVHGKDANGQPKVVGQGQWPAILDMATHESLKHLLTDPKRRTSFSIARAHLLSGLARCAECGATVRGVRRSGGGRTYICSTGRHVHRPADEVDRMVEEDIVARLEESDAAGVVEDDTSADLVTSITMRKVEVEQERDQRAVELAGAGLSADALVSIMAGYDTKLAALQEDLDKARRSARRSADVLEGMTGTDAATAWAGASLGRRQAVIDFLCESITVKGSDHGRRRELTDSDIQVVFRKLA